MSYKIFVDIHYDIYYLYHRNSPNFFRLFFLCRGGFLIGLCVSLVSLSVVDSAVNAVIVLFAEAPGEFQDHYPELSTKMREAYMSAYPDLM